VPTWLLPWLFPVGLLLLVIALAVSPIVGAVLAVAGGLVGLPFVYRAYQANRPGRTGDARDRRADPPNNRSLLR
jgi:hypothetical protein